MHNVNIRVCNNSCGKTGPISGLTSSYMWLPGIDYFIPMWYVLTVWRFAKFFLSYAVLLYETCLYYCGSEALELTSYQTALYACSYGF